MHENGRSHEPGGLLNMQGRAEAVGFLALWVAVTGYALLYLHKGWIPHDDGAFAHAAERTLRGELPHRDFIEPYTGGLTYLHALAMDWFGIRLMSLRWVLLTAYVLWIPCVYGLLRRTVSSGLAAFGTVAVAALSIPNYSASMPSWYNLFLATAAAWALLAWWDSKRWLWAFLAGLLAGVSILVKIAGLYLVAGALLAFALLEQEGRTTGPEGGRPYSVVITLLAAAFALAVLVLLNGSPHPSTFVQLGLPAVVVAALIIFREWSGPPGHLAVRLKGLFEGALPFIAGVTIPVMAFAFFYLAQGSVGSLWEGVFVLPRLRIGAGVRSPPNLIALVFAVVLPLLIWIGRKWAPSTRVRLVGLGVALAAALALSAQPTGFVAIWLTIHQAPLVVALITVPALLLFGVNRSWPGKTETMVLLAVLVPCSLIQFPLPAPVYALYAAPLALMILVVSVGRSGFLRRGELVLILTFYTVFLGLWGHGGRIMHQAHEAEPGTWTAPLELARGGIMVSREEAEDYQGLAELVHDRLEGRSFYAFPDGAELYFLLGLENPTRNVYDVFSEPVSEQTLMDNLDDWDVGVVAVRTWNCCWAPAPTPELLAALERRFPGEQHFSNFVVRWRD